MITKTLMYFMCAGDWVPVSLWIHPRVCARTRTRNQARGRGGQISTGLRGSECMLGAGLCSLCTLWQLWVRKESKGKWRNKREEERKWMWRRQQGQTLWKRNSTGGGRDLTTRCKGAALKKREVVNPVWASYPTLHCVPSFGKGLSPRSRVFVCVCVVGIKMIDWSLGGGVGSAGEGFGRAGHPRFLSHTSEYSNINNTEKSHTHWTHTLSKLPPPPPHTLSSPSARQTQWGEGGGGARLGGGCIKWLLSLQASNYQIPADQSSWYVCLLHHTTKPA